MGTRKRPAGISSNTSYEGNLYIDELVIEPIQRDGDKITVPFGGFADIPIMSGDEAVGIEPKVFRGSLVKDGDWKLSVSLPGIDNSLKDGFRVPPWIKDDKQLALERVVAKELIPRVQEELSKPEGFEGFSQEEAEAWAKTFIIDMRTYGGFSPERAEEWREMTPQEAHDWDWNGVKTFAEAQIWKRNNFSPVVTHFTLDMGMTAEDIDWKVNGDECLDIQRKGDTWCKECGSKDNWDDNPHKFMGFDLVCQGQNIRKTGKNAYGLEVPVL